MPSFEDCITAQHKVKEWAIEQLVKEGHSQFSAIEIVKHMSYDNQVKKAEEVVGEIYRGAYSPY